MISYVISKDIVIFLQQKGYSNDEIAQMIGEPASFINDILKNKNIFSEEHLIKIKKGINTTLTSLLINAIPKEHFPISRKKIYEKLKNRAKIIKDLENRIKKE